MNIYASKSHTYQFWKLTIHFYSYHLCNCILEANFLFFIVIIYAIVEYDIIALSNKVIMLY